MEPKNTPSNTNAVPTHLFVKSSKQAKKIDKRIEQTDIEPVIFRKNKSTNPLTNLLTVNSAKLL